MCPIDILIAKRKAVPMYASVCVCVCAVNFSLKEHSFYFMSVSIITAKLFHNFTVTYNTASSADPKEHMCTHTHTLYANHMSTQCF